MDQGNLQKRLFDLYKLRAETSNKLWNHWEAKYVEDRSDESQGQSESWRNHTKQYAREWLDYAKSKFPKNQAGTQPVHCIGSQRLL